MKDMEPTANGDHKKEEEKEGEIKNVTGTNSKLRDFIPIYIPTVEKGLICQSPQNTKFLDFLRAQPSKDWFLKFNIMGKLEQDGTNSFRVPFVRKISWKLLIQYAKNWIRHPMNIALLVWLSFVAVGLVILALLMTGLLNKAIPDDSQRKRWIEIINQILNALFTILCLYQHPKIFHHLVILCRWNSKDAVDLRMAYCQTLAKRPNERAHMAVVIVLLHFTCLAQYMLCSLYWGWSSKTRPDWAQNLCIGLGTGAPIIAGLYTVYSPLGRKITNPETDAEIVLEIETDEDSRAQPEWVGGIFDCWDNYTVSCLSFFCTFCVFGWNMERLGFGNMYVHIVTFMLLCIAPFLVFYVASLNINDEALQYTVEVAGDVLCFCGLIYGGFWRVQMRKKFKLPANSFCFGFPAVSDFMQWLFCWACALAQEVRTGNFYEIEEERFHRRNLEEGERVVLEPLPREGEAGFREDKEVGAFVLMKGESNPVAGVLSIAIEGEMAVAESDRTMSAPVMQRIRIEDNQQPKS